VGSDRTTDATHGALPVAVAASDVENALHLVLVEELG
jgi:hypothetical protein